MHIFLCKFSILYLVVLEVVKGSFLLPVKLFSLNEGEFWLSSVYDPINPFFFFSFEQMNSLKS